jgi:hypothetical protein
VSVALCRQIQLYDLTTGEKRSEVQVGSDTVSATQLHRDPMSLQHPPITTYTPTRPFGNFPKQCMTRFATRLIAIYLLPAISPIDRSTASSFTQLFHLSLRPPGSGATRSRRPPMTRVATTTSSPSPCELLPVTASEPVDIFFFRMLLSRRHFRDRLRLVASTETASCPSSKTAMQADG